MKRVAILTSLNMPNLMPYDLEVIRLLNATGKISAEPIIWETEANKLYNFDTAIFRTTWGYHEKPLEFWDFLTFIEKCGIPTLNPIHIIKSNFHKFYLRELAQKGINLIPTEFVPSKSNVTLQDILEAKNWEKFIIKPAVSAGSYRTHLFSAENIIEAVNLFNSLNLTDDLIVQKYLPEVESIGEFSTIFFNGGYHFTINKIPQKGDYRVQFNYGGVYNQIEPNDAVMQASKTIAGQYIDECLYVRVDGLFSDGQFCLMEVEMLEPDLYLNINPAALPEFVKAIINMI